MVQNDYWDYCIYSKKCWLFTLSILAIAVNFTFTPYPEAKIEAYQSVYYHCSVNNTGVSISWFVNGTGSGNNKIIQLNIVTNGAGSHNSSLTIPGYLQYNNTVVRCNAFGTVNGKSYVNFNKSVLRIQGNTLFGIHLYISIIFCLVRKTSTSWESCM